MLMETVQYEDFNGDQQKEDLYFNLTKTDATMMLDMQPRMEAFDKVVKKGKTLTTAETLELLDIIKELARRSFGLRSEDGKYHRKTSQITEDFEASAAYDAFLFGLFENPEKAIRFMTGIMPRKLMEEAMAQVDGGDALQTAVNNAEKAVQRQIEEAQIPDVNTDETYSAVEKEVPAYMRENRAATIEELQKMTQPEMLAAYQFKNNL